MRNGEWSTLVKVVGRLLLACLLVLSQAVWAAGQEQKAQDNPKPAQKAATQLAGEKPSSAATALKPQTPNVEGEESEKEGTQEKPSGDGKHEGIKVHGHWTIEVRNPDGTLVTHREFENAYQPGGNVLPNVLARLSTMGSWGIEFNGSTCTTIPGACDITEPGSGLPGHSSTLSATNTNANSPTNNPGASVILSGNIQMATATQITSVWTFLGQCPTYLVPSVTACVSTGPTLGNVNITIGQFYSAFTMKDLTASPIPVAAGQTVQVTVNISFS